MGPLEVAENPNLPRDLVNEAFAHVDRVMEAAERNDPRRALVGADAAPEPEVTPDELAHAA